MIINNKGFTLIEMVMVSVIGTIIMLAFAGSMNMYVKFLKRAKVDVETLLAEVRSETSSIPRYCKNGDTNCVCPKPAICAHTFTNGKTVQACVGDCVKTAGNHWYKGTQACDVAMICTKN